MAKKRVWLLCGLLAAILTGAAFWTQWWLTDSPAAYEKGTERYYLAWVHHGSFGQKGAAVEALLNLPQKKEYTVALKVRRWQTGVIRDMLLLVLFDMAPDQHEQAVTQLMRSEYESGYGWVKTDDVFEGVIVDFYFDGPGEAALRLLQQGYLSGRAVDLLLQYARSFYPEHRLRASHLFEQFVGIPPYDPTPQPQTINEMPELTRTQTAAIERWLRGNMERLSWAKDMKSYLYEPRP
jgi:hypothetical protein